MATDKQATKTKPIDAGQSPPAQGGRSGSHDRPGQTGKPANRQTDRPAWSASRETDKLNKQLLLWKNGYDREKQKGT